MILTTVPISLRKPGVYSELEFVENAQSLVALTNRVVVVAEASGGTATVELPVELFNVVDADAKLGVGTPAALAARMCFKTAQLKGTSPEIWACPIAEPGGGVKAAETITVTGPATQAGTLILRIAGNVVQVGINNADAQNTIAAAIKTALDGLKTTLPITAGVAANVVTCTNVTKGVNGNDVAYETLQTVPGVTIALAQSVAGAGAASITNALAALYDRRYHAIITSNHTTTDIATELIDGALAWGFAQANYRFYFMGERGSLGTAQTLQAASDYFPIHVISCEGCPRTPVEMAAAAATAWMAREAPNANLDGDILPLEPPSGALAYTNAEIESGLNGGVTPLIPAGSFVSIVRLTTTQISVSASNAAPFEPLRDSAYPRTSAWLAEQIAIKIASGIQQAVETDDLLNDARDIIIEVDRAAERIGYIRDVDDFIDQIKAEFASSPAGRMNTTNPHRVAGPLHQVVNHNTMYQ